jgi:beta-mannanase
MLGVYERGVPASYNQEDTFTSATGLHPNIVLYYSGWFEKFWTSFADAAYRNGAMPFVQLQSGNASLAAIAAGHYDSYLRTYAKSVRAYGHPVILGFDHEMNGSWYAWGAGHAEPSKFIAAWRHVVATFRAEGASNVIWIWTINSLNAAKALPSEWWPGASYVNWVGIDGYYYRSTDTFASVFGTTVSQVRTFTSDPVFISETAVGPIAGPSKITDLFAGVRADDLLGLLWFDEAQHDGLYHQDWRLEDDPAALAAFRGAARFWH